MKLFITRHWETEENIKWILQWHMHWILTDTGIKQAKKLALRLKNYNFDAIYSSDLWRAKDTSIIISEHQLDNNIIYSKSIREIDFGNFQASSKKDFDRNIIDEKKDIIRANKWECLEDLYHRAENFLQEISKKHTNDNVLVVCHWGIASAMITSLTTKNYKDIRILGEIHNTSLSIFDINEKESQEILYNCIEHLE